MVEVATQGSVRGWVGVCPYRFLALRTRPLLGFPNRLTSLSMSSPPPSPTGRVPGPPPNVLVVDDEEAIRAALKRFFSRRGWIVVEAADGESARSLLDPASGHAFELVICDLSLPRLSGRDLYRWLSRHHPDALPRLVFSSGDVISRDSSTFLVETGRPVLPKPFELSQLSRIVEDVWRAAHAA